MRLKLKTRINRRGNRRTIVELDSLLLKSRDGQEKNGIGIITSRLGRRDVDLISNDGGVSGG